MKIQNKIMFLASVMSAIVVAMITIVTSSCSHGSSGHDYYVGGEVGNYSLDITKPIEEGSYDGELEHYCYDGVTVAETVVLLSSLTGECSCQTCDGNCDGTVKIRVKDKSEADRRALADVLRSMEEDVKVYLDLHYTYVDAGSYAFANCKSLEGIVLASHQEELGGGSFSECENLKEVHCPENLKTIGDRAFYNCERLTTLTEDGSNKLPKSLKSMGYDAFYYCSSLITIDLSETQLKEIPNYAFYMYSSSSLTTVYLPETIESIGYGAFYYCESLTTLTKDGNNKLPKSLKSMGSCAFENCISLKTIDLSETQLKEIPGNAFFDCYALDTVCLPDTLEYIGAWAFYYCESLTALTKDGNNKLPKSLKSMGSCAFKGCSSLTSLIIEKESGKAWGHPSGIIYEEESNPSVETLTMIPCFEKNAVYFLTGEGELQCGTSCCQEGGETCCGEEGSTCACAKLTNSDYGINFGYNYWWYKVAYPE